MIVSFRTFLFVVLLCTSSPWVAAGGSGRLAAHNHKMTKNYQRGALPPRDEANHVPPLHTVHLDEYMVCSRC